MMKAIILSAGEGRRLKPLTDKYPKPMLEIGGKPLLEHTINLLKKHGITEIAINLHHPEIVMNYFGDGSGFDVRIRYSIEKELLGTAGALNNFRDFFDDTFIVFYGDVFTDTDITKLIAFHKEKKSIATIGLYKVDNPSECGIVKLEENMRITRFVEKPGRHEIFTDLANAGLYVLEPLILNYIPERGEYDFGKELFPRLLREGKAIYGFPITDYLIDIGTKDKYERARKGLLAGRIHLC